MALNEIFGIIAVAAVFAGLLAFLNMAFFSKK